MVRWLITLHVIGASVWVGGHLVLALTYLPEALKERSVERLQAFEHRFEKVGIPALLVQIITGFWLASIFVPKASRWIDWNDMQGRTVGLKLLCLVLTAILAADARLRIIPKLTSENIRSLAWHIIPVTVISLVFLIAGIALRFGGL